MSLNLTPGGLMPPVMRKNKNGGYGRSPRDATAERAAQSRVLMGNREFMVWDGEGAGVDENGGQNYVLFGWQNLDDSGYISGRSLRSQECLDFLYDTLENHVDYIHVSFGFGYDVDQILKDLPEDSLRELVAVNGDHYTSWGGYRIDYLPHKLFKIKKWGKGQRTYTICDAMTFFATSLIKAARQYVPDHPELETVKAGKDLRGEFDFRDLYSTIIPYWRVENKLFLSTMIALRYALKGAGISLVSWHGPGAVANALIKQHRLATHIATSREEMPVQVTEACQFAYFGGRFEDILCGHIPGPIYAYDLRSAYPAAMAQMPGLSGGQWRQTREVDQWGIYRYKLKHDTARLGLSPQLLLQTGSLPNRAEDGTVAYSIVGEGWAFGHEIIAARMSGADLDILDGWIYDVKTPTYPFIYNHEMYVKRSQFKKAGNPAQLGLKLGLNSTYGKLAQCVGFDAETMRPPRFHHAWYAGHTTSWCRARIQLAMNQDPTNIIAVETDGIYSLVPLKLKVGTHLGEWEETRYDEMYYVQSGFYYARQGECPAGCIHRPSNEGSQCAWKTTKVRGLSSASKGANLSDVFDSCETLAPITTEVARYGALTSHIGRKTAHSWFQQERTADWGGGGKREHNPTMCPRCQGTDESFHRTVLTRPFVGASHPRSLPWEVLDPELCDLPLIWDGS